MATVSMCYKDHSLLNPKELRENVKHSQFGFIAIQENCGCLSLVSSGSCRPVVNNSTGTLSKFSTRKNARVSQGIIFRRGFLTFKTMTKPFVQHNMHMVLGHLQFCSSKASQQQKSPILCHAFKSGLNQKQLESLDAYFGKLKQDGNRPSPASFNKKEEIIEQSGSFKAKEVLGSLEGYFGKVDKGKISIIDFSLSISMGAGISLIWLGIEFAHKKVDIGYRGTNFLNFGAEYEQH